MNRTITANEIAASAADYAFKGPLVVNNLRAIVVEAIVRAVLPTDWTWCARDWAECDFKHEDGTLLEIKQSAAKQTWSSPKSSRRTFDIRPRTGRYEDSAWIQSPLPTRFAHIYLFAFHPLEDAQADHRNPEQ
jgi:hypothetical protein